MKLLTGDITKIETDAIVNAASPDLASVSRHLRCLCRR